MREGTDEQGCKAEQVEKNYSALQAEEAARELAERIEKSQMFFSTFGAADSEGRIPKFAIIEAFFGEELADKNYW